MRRAEAAVELANSGTLDPATALLLAGAASDSLDARADDMSGSDWAEGDLATREALESDLTVTIRHALASSGTPASDPTRRLRDAHRRVQLARRFSNDAVRDVQRLRREPEVRLFRLAGHAALPRTVEFDDDV